MGLEYWGLENIITYEIYNLYLRLYLRIHEKELFVEGQDTKKITKKPRLNSIRAWKLSMENKYGLGCALDKMSVILSELEHLESKIRCQKKEKKIEDFNIILRDMSYDFGILAR